MQLPQTFPVSLFRPRYADGEMPLVGAYSGMVQALLRIGRAACKSKSKTARNLNQMALLYYKSNFTTNQTFPNGTFHRLVARENARFQNYATRVTGARDLARRALAICRIHCACASDQPSRAMQKLCICRIACDSV